MHYLFSNDSEFPFFIFELVVQLYYDHNILDEVMASTKKHGVFESQLLHDIT